MRVLVTGGTGFIGGPLLKLLSSETDIEAVVLARRPGKDHGNIRYIEADLSESRSVEAFASSAGSFDVLVHLMALIPTVGAADPGPHEYVRQNIGATVNLIACLGGRVKRVVYGSTLDVYGPVTALPVTEAHQTEPLTCYGATKLAAEKLLAVFCRERGIPLSILRFSQVYGPGEPVIKAIPAFISAVVDGRPPVVFGDGSDLRDYVYVDDAAAAVMSAVKGDASGGVFNISGGRPVSLLEVLETIITAGKTSLRPVFENRRKDRIDMHFDISRAKDILGWSPQVSLADGIEREVRYFESLRDGSR
ncbi:MAG: NAD-dependent epimerase/dehydratase family protein [Deltaproteobacteria bacterium]